MKLQDIPTPAFCVDVSRVERNCSKMLGICRQFGVQLRPHTKTHKTIEAALLSTGGRRSGIAVSTIAEVEFFATKGAFDDILYAYPLTADKIPYCKKFTDTMKTFHVLVDSKEMVESLSNTLLTEGKHWSVFVEVDCGYGRSGVVWDSDDAVALVSRIVALSPQLSFAGLYTHCGSSYATARTGRSVAEVASEAAQRLHDLAARLRSTGIESPVIGIGSTPSCSQLTTDDKHIKQLTEMHPGNYIFYDVQNVTLGSCRLDEIACTVITRVIGHYPQRNQLLVDCGFTALTQQGMHDSPLPSGGVVFKDQPQLKLVKMTQEIGTVTTTDGSTLAYNSLPVGIALQMYPWHSCATAAQHRVYYVHNGTDDMVIDEWRPVAGWY